MATTYKKLKYDNSECAVQYAYEAGKATCDSNGKEIASTYYDLSKNINVTQGNDLLNYSGIEIGNTGNDMWKSRKYVVKAITTNQSSKYLKIFASTESKESGAQVGSIHIYGVIGGWALGEIHTTIDLMIATRYYGGSFWGTYYAYNKTSSPINKVDLIVGADSNSRVNVYLQFKQDYAFAMLNVDSITNCQDLSMTLESSLPTLTEKTTLSAQISAGNVKNLLA